MSEKLTGGSDSGFSLKIKQNLNLPQSAALEEVTEIERFGTNSNLQSEINVHLLIH